MQYLLPWVYTRGDGHADLSYVYAAAEEIAKTAQDYIVVVTKSTVPVGTNRQVKQIIRKTNPNLQFDVASNPEFLREGAAIEDFMRPDRVVIGVQNDRAKSVMEDIYRPLYLRDYPIVSTDLESRVDQICRKRIFGDENHLYE